MAPAHENVPIDLFSAETGQFLAETLELLGDTLDQEVRNRVHQEVERRIFDPYIRYHHLNWWYKGGNNWNGVCNGAGDVFQEEGAGPGQQVELGVDNEGRQEQQCDPGRSLDGRERTGQA